MDKKKKKIAALRVGETRKMKCGMNATIITYHGSTNIDIRFEDGTVVTNKEYAAFKRGEVAHPGLCYDRGTKTYVKCDVTPEVPQVFRPFICSLSDGKLRVFFDGQQDAYIPVTEFSSIMTNKNPKNCDTVADFLAKDTGIKEHMRSLNTVEGKEIVAVDCIKHDALSKILMILFAERSLGMGFEDIVLHCVNTVTEINNFVAGSAVHDPVAQRYTEAELDKLLERVKEEPATDAVAKSALNATTVQAAFSWPEGEAQLARIASTMEAFCERMEKIMQLVLERSATIPAVALEPVTTEPKKQKPPKKVVCIQDGEKYSASEEKKHAWKTRMYALATDIATAGSDFKNTKDVLSFTYTYMRNVYGIVWEQEHNDYKAAHNGIPGKTLDVIYENAQYRSILEACLSDRLSNLQKKSGKSESAPKNAEKPKRQDNRVAVVSELTSIIQPLVDARGDKSFGSVVTYSKVFSEMEKHGVDWEALISREKQNKPASYRPTKRDIILADENLKKLFTVVVNQLLSEMK